MIDFASSNKDVWHLFATRPFCVIYGKAKCRIFGKCIITKKQIQSDIRVEAIFITYTLKRLRKIC